MLLVNSSVLMPHLLSNSLEAGKANVTDIFKYLKKYPDPESLSDIVILVDDNDIENSRGSGSHHIKKL